MNTLSSQSTTPRRFGIRWLLIGWMFLISAIAYLDRVNISIAGQAIAKDFRLTNVQLGWVFSAFVVGYALFQAPGGWLADKLGPRLTLSIAVLWWAIFTVLITWLLPGWPALIPLLIALRFSLGIGEAVMYPASNTMVAAWIPSAERGLANGIIFAGVGFGAGITPPLITYVLVTYGWRASFWVSAAVGLIAGAIWYVLARNRPSEHPWVSVDEQNYIKAGLPAHAEKSGERLSLSTIVRNPQILAVTFSYFTFGYVAYIFFSWFFIYLSSVRGLNLKQSAFYSMLPFLAMSAGSTVGGWISDRLVARWGARVGRSYFSMVSLALAAIFLGLGTQVQSAELASVVLAGGAGSLYLSQSCFWSVSADIGGSSAGLVSGVMNMGAQIGGAVTASLTPVIANEFGWTASFLVAAGLSAVGALAWIPVRSQDRSSLAVDKAPSPITH